VACATKRSSVEAMARATKRSKAERELNELSPNYVQVAVQ